MERNSIYVHDNRCGLMRGLLVGAWLLASVQVAMAVQTWPALDNSRTTTASVEQADDAPEVPREARLSALRVTDYMMSGNFRYPDQKPFVLDHWWKGLSISTFWYPKMLNFQWDYQGIETSGFGLALTKDFSKSHALRMGFAYNHDRLEGMLDYQWNLSNYWGGYRPSRRVEWLATVGLTGGAARYEGGYRKFVGGQVGLQLRHTLSPWVSLYVEPQYKAITSLYDGRWELGNIVDDGLAVQVGLVTRLTGPLKEGGYGTAVANGSKAFGRGVARGASAFGRGMMATGRWMSDLAGKVFLGHGMMVDPQNTLHRWYIELLGGTQLRSGEHSIDKIRPYEGDFEMNLGLRLNNLLSVQMGAFGERLDLTQRSKYAEQVYGYRVEATLDLLRLAWRGAEAKGWAWTVGGGLEAGRVELWNHVPRLNKERYLAPTAHTQLRRRLWGQTWLVMEGRWQHIDVDHDDLQLLAFAGVHHRLVTRKMEHGRPGRWWKGFWLAGSWGGFDMRNSLVRGSVGYDFNDAHSVRLDYSYSHVDSHNVHYFKKMYLNLFGVDYMLNVRNAFAGQDAGRRLNVWLFAGYNLSVHELPDDRSLWHAHSYVGMEGGAQLELRLSNHLSVFAEEKTMFLSVDPFLTNDFTQGLGMTGLVGLKVRL